MRKTLLWIICSLLLQLHLSVNAQEITKKNALSAGVRLAEWSSASVNYNRIVFQRPAFKIATGVGLAVMSSRYRGTYLLSAPLEASALIGRTKHYLEGGVGVMPGTYQFYNIIEGQSLYQNEFTVPGLAILGYRYQKSEGGLFFKAAFTPMLFLINNQRAWGGVVPGGSISAGISF